MIHNTITQLALELPGGNKIPQPSLGPLQGALKDQYKDLGSFISPLLNIVFYIAVFLAFYYLIWGAFQYIMAQGKKEDLAKARARISWALIGLIVVFAAFLIAKYASEIFKTQGGLPF